MRAPQSRMLITVVADLSLSLTDQAITKSSAHGQVTGEP
jgi:hypothetical protein